jgi:NADPH:quinone reductase-like Zn-dependent oxidoreductase
MKAVVQDRYGPPDVLSIEDVEEPTAQGDEVLIRVRATTVARIDVHARAANPVFWRLYGGIRRPRWRALGVEFAGEVESVGDRVTRFAVGDAVFGAPQGFGTHCELVSVRESGALAHKPAGLSFDEAAALCDGPMQALAALRTADIHAGQRIVIYGASGSLGTAAVQLARHFGAHVTAVCNTKNVDVVKSLGADVVVDYEQADFTRNGETYDAIIDAVGKYSFLRGRRSLRPGGIYVATDLGRFHLGTVLMWLATRWIGSKRVKVPPARRNKLDVQFVKELVEAGGYRPVIDRRYAMDQVVEAHRYVETLQKTGNVVLTISEGSEGVSR